jgi:hypothetical protein
MTGKKRKTCLLSIHSIRKSSDGLTIQSSTQVEQMERKDHYRVKRREERGERREEGRGTTASL